MFLWKRATPKARLSAAVVRSNSGMRSFAAKEAEGAAAALAGQLGAPGPGSWMWRV